MDDNRATMFTRLAANGTKVIHSRAGFLGKIVINTKGATSNTLTVYNSTTGSGDVIAVIDTTVAPGFFPYNVECPAGLTIVSASGTAADVTITSGGPGA